MLPSAKSKYRVALVELNDNESEQILRYYRHDDWEVAAAYFTNAALWPARLAHSLGIPVLHSLEDLVQLECERIVVGASAGDLLKRLAEMVDWARTEVCGPEQSTTVEGISGSGHGPGQDSLPGPADGSSPSTSVMDPMPQTRPLDREYGSAPVGSDSEPAKTPRLGGAMNLVSSKLKEPESLESSSPPLITEATEGGPISSPVPPVQELSPPAPVNPEPRIPDPEFSNGDDDIWKHLDRLNFDPSRGDLSGFLRSTCRRLKANSASLAVLDRDREGIRLIAWHGLNAEVAANPRKSLECGAGRTLLGGGPQVIHSLSAPMAEDDSKPAEMTYCSLPVTSRGGVLAALNLSIPRKLDLNLLDLPQDIRNAASEAEFHLLKSAETASLNWSNRRELLLCGVDRALSLDESLPERLRAASEILALHLSAATSHLYLTDLTGEKLQLVSQPTGFGSLGARFQDLRTGLLGWAVRTNRTHFFLPIEDAGPGIDKQGICFLPLANERRTVGLIAVEGMPVPPGEEGVVNQVLIEVSRAMNEMLSVEQGLGDQDVFGQIRIRLTEIIPELDTMEPLARAQAALDATMEALAADAAVWISPTFPSPVLPRTMNEAMLRTLAKFWPEMSRLTTHTRENGRSWHLPTEAGPGPETAVHYAGVSQPDCDGVLVALFGESLKASPTSQLTIATIVEILHSVSEHVEKRDIPSTDSSAPSRILNLPEIQKRIMEEWFRSLRFGHGFSVSRIQMPSDQASDENLTRLRDFMRRVKRNVDFLCESKSGVFCLVSPETERFPEGLQFRIQSLWRNEGADTQLVIEQMIYPRDGQSRKPFLDFAARAD